MDALYPRRRVYPAHDTLPSAAYKQRLTASYSCTKVCVSRLGVRVLCSISSRPFYVLLHNMLHHAYTSGSIYEAGRQIGFPKR